MHMGLWVVISLREYIEEGGNGGKLSLSDDLLGSFWQIIDRI